MNESLPKSIAFLLHKQKIKIHLFKNATHELQWALNHSKRTEQTKSWIVLKRYFPAEFKTPCD